MTISPRIEAMTTVPRNARGVQAGIDSENDWSRKTLKAKLML